MAKFPKNVATGAAGAAKAKAASTGGGGKFTTNFFWKAGEKRYLQFLTEYDDIPTIAMHVVNVGQTRTGKTMMRNFVDPRVWHGEDSDNALVEKGWEPKLKRVAVAVEVVPIMGKKNGRNVPVGWEVATRSFNRKNGEEVTVPNVGVIINTQTLFAHVDTYFEDNGTINDAVFNITRNGGDTSTSYSLNPQKGDPVEVDEDLMGEIDLAEYLEGLADPAVIRETVESLPDDWEFDYSKREKTSAKPRKVKAVEPDEEDEDADEDDDDGDEDAAEAKKTKFAAMKSQSLKAQLG